MSSARALLAAAVASFAAGFGALAVLQQRAFETGRFDVGNLTQAVWSTAHGDFLEVTSLAGNQISRLGAHFDPLAAALAPLWWVWPDPSLLLVAQAAAVSLGALPVFRLGRRHLGSDRAGLAFALVYLLYPATQWLVLDDVHTVALATPLLLFAFDYLDQDRLLAFAAVAALACLTKEHVGLAVAMLGIWYAVARGRRRAGAAIAVTGTAVALIATAIVVPHFHPGGGSPFADRYADVGGTPTGILETAVSDPGAIVERSDERTRPRVPARPAPTPRRPPAPGAAGSCDRTAGARRESDLRDAHADVDSLPLHGDGDPGPHRRIDLRGEPSSPPTRRLGSDSYRKRSWPSCSRVASPMDRCPYGGTFLSARTSVRVTMS